MTAARGENKPNMKPAWIRAIQAVDFVLFVIIDLAISRLV